MCRIDRDRCQQRIQFPVTISIDKAHRFGVEFMQPENTNFLFRQGWTQPRVPAVILVVNEIVRLLVQDFALFAERQPVGPGLVVPILDLLHHRRYAHFEELIQVAGRDRQEFQPLQQRIPLVFRLLQNTPVEREPGDIAVEKVLRVVERNTRHGRALRIFRVNSNCNYGTVSIEHSHA